MINIVGELPQFTADDSAGQEKVIIEEVKETPFEGEEAKDTPSELPAEEKPAEPLTISEEGKGDDIKEPKKQVQGLLSEREKLLKEIQELRGQRRELRKVETQEVVTDIADQLDDLNPDDIKNIERVLKSKGYVTKDESHKIHYESVKTQTLDEFLEKYPEYKPENDPNDINWNAFQREVSFYKMPDNPMLISQILEKAHRNTSGAGNFVDRSISVAQKRIATARKGGGGMQRSSVGKSLPSHLRRVYEDGGWSEAEIKEIENKL